MGFNEELKAIEEIIDPTALLRPTNESEMREQLRAGGNIDAYYDWDTLNAYPAEEIDRRLQALEVPKGPYAPLFAAKISQLALFNHMIADCGNKDFMLHYSYELFGAPSAELQQTAVDILEAYPAQVEKRELSSDQMVRAVERALEELGIDGFEIDHTEERSIVSVNATTKTIYIPKNNQYSATEIQRLPVHEVGTHVVRTHNGAQQESSSLFHLGFPNYLPTEEGLATYSELLAGVLDISAIRRYAGRVLAVAATHDREGFVRTYDMLRDFELSDDDAWNIVFRQWRGQGFAKDHVYLEGLAKVVNFIQQGEDIKDLFVGRIAIEHLGYLRPLMEDGTITPPDVIPSHIHNEPEKTKLLEILTRP